MSFIWLLKRANDTFYILETTVLYLIQLSTSVFWRLLYYTWYSYLPVYSGDHCTIPDTVIYQCIQESTVLYLIQLSTSIFWRPLYYSWYSYLPVYSGDYCNIPDTVINPLLTLLFHLLAEHLQRIQLKRQFTNRAGKCSVYEPQV